MKKKVILTIGHPKHKAPAGFITEYQRINGNIDGIICLSINDGLLFKIKSKLKFLKKINYNTLNNFSQRFFAYFFNKTILNQLKESWETRGENSWDLLDYEMDIKMYASDNNIKFIQGVSLNKNLIFELSEGMPSLLVVYGAGIIKKELIGIPSIEFINAHMGEMPKYRGMHVIEWAALENNKPKASLMVMNENIDGGDILLEKFIPIQKARSIADLRKVGYEYCAKVMAEGVLKYSEGKISRRIQPKGAKYYYKMHDKIRAMLTEKLITNTFNLNN